MKHVVCYSGGHSSALVAIEVVRKFGKDNVVLLNHDIAKHTEHSDIKRFKNEVADYLGINITYANHKDLQTKQVDQFDVCIKERAFKYHSGKELCTKLLKTDPFMEWLETNTEPENTIIYYGFDKGEKLRIQRRSSALAVHGYKTDYPLALWDDSDRTIQKTHDIGIPPPLTYGAFKHANCIGCLKAGKQHWYITYLTRYDIFCKAKQAEDIIGYSIIKGIYMDELELLFDRFKALGITTTEEEDGRTFMARAKKLLKSGEKQEWYDDLSFIVDIFLEGLENEKPCECTI